MPCLISPSRGKISPGHLEVAGATGSSAESGHFEQTNFTEFAKYEEILAPLAPTRSSISPPEFPSGHGT